MRLCGRGNAMINRGDEAELLTRDDVRRMVPYLDFDSARFPIYGGLLQRRAGTARHDAVAWGYARAADERGVDLVQNCEVTGIDMKNGKVTGVQTTRGRYSSAQNCGCRGGAVQSGGGDGGDAPAD